MNLLDQIFELDRELDNVISGEDNSTAIADLTALSDTFLPYFVKLKSSIYGRHLFENLPGNYSINSQTDEELVVARGAIKKLDKFIDIWKTLDKKHTIMQKDICSDIQTIVETLSNALGSRDSIQYRSWVNQIKNQVYVSEADLDSQNNYHELKQNAHHYNQSFSILDDRISSGVSSIAGIEELVSLRDKLVVCRDKMEFDQPEDVALLFQHLRKNSSGGKAPLNMMTPIVIEWLQEHGQYDFFYIGDSRLRNHR